MNFQEAEKVYKDLNTQHTAGKLSDAAFEAEVAKLRLQDNQGRWWQLGVQSGEWYMHDGQKWTKAKPPASAPLTEPVSLPESAPAPAPTVRASTSAPPPVATAPKSEPPAKKDRNSAVPARPFSPAPSGREGGLSTPVLFAIIGVVALIGIALIVGGYFLLNSQTPSTAKTTATPTRVAAALTATLPVVAPTIKPTEVAIVPPTPIVTATVAVTPTTALTSTLPTKTPAARVPTATRKPGTPGPSPTVTATVPNVPPGLYVTGLKTDPSVVNIGDSIAFKMTMLNTTGQMQTYRWIIKVFQCPAQCTGDSAFRNAYGESLKVDSNITTGTVELTTPKHVNFGTGACDYTAIPYYIDPVSQAVIPFQTIKGGALYYSFSVCH